MVTVPTVIDTTSDLFIFRLFLWRCVSCNHMATEINHIVPRSRGKDFKDDWKNKVPQCHTCHDEYHAGGVSDTKIYYLRKQRAEYLVKIGKAEYV